MSQSHEEWLEEKIHTDLGIMMPRNEDPVEFLGGYFQALCDSSKRGLDLLGKTRDHLLSMLETLAPGKYDEWEHEVSASPECVPLLAEELLHLVRVYCE